VIIAYRSGFEVLTDHRRAVLGGQCELLLLTLATEYDGAALHCTVDLARDLDAMAGPRCVILAFMPPEASGGIVAQRFGAGQLPKPGESGWEGFVAAMTSATYEIARYFRIDEKRLPCLVALDPRNEREFAVVPLRSQTLVELMPSLRRLFSEWYSGDSESESLERDRTLASLVPSRDFANPSTYVRSVLTRAVAEDIVPSIQRAIDATAPTLTKRGCRTLKAGANQLRANPTAVIPLSSAMRSRGVNITVEGVELRGDDMMRGIDALYELQVALPARRRIAGGSPSEPFPLYRFKDLGAEVVVRDLTTRAVKHATKAGAFVKWLLDVGKSLKP
jgi:hypothetical protein